MFVPIAALINEKPLKNVEDCVTALETYVLPRYKAHTTSNVGFTKQECYGVLASFFQAGKLNPHMIDKDIELAVEHFMDKSLWVTPQQFRIAPIQHSYQPSVWFRYPLRNQVRDLFNIYKNVTVGALVAVDLTFRLFLTNIIRFCKLSTYKLRRQDVKARKS